MAHLAKYTRGATGNMMHHYKRDREVTLERENVNRELTPENYLIGPGLGVERIQERIREVEATMTRSVRSDAAVLCDWVVTAPPDVRREDLPKFFRATYEFVQNRYGGEQNMLGGWVHMDETTPHIHIAFMPVVEREGGKLAFSAKTMINKADLDSFHQQLSRELERSLGYSCQILLEQEQALEKSLSRVGSMKEFQQAKDGLERLRGRERELGERNRELERNAGGLRRTVAARERELGKAQARERQIERTHQALQAEVEGLAREIGAERGRARALDRAIELVRGRVEELQRKLEAFRDRARERVREIGRAVGRALGRTEERTVDLERVLECVRAHRERQALTVE